MNVLRFVYK